jgi:hypothetical protein
VEEMERRNTRIRSTGRGDDDGRKRGGGGEEVNTNKVE